MSETRPQSPQPVPPGMAIGQAVGQAESVLSRLLAGVLAEAGTERKAYFALQRLTVLGDTARRDDYLNDLSDWLDIDLWSAGELADRLAAGTSSRSPTGSCGWQRRERGCASGSGTPSGT